MPRRFLLTYDKSLRQWVKVIKGRKYYFGKGASKTHREDYERALALYRERLPGIVEAASAPPQPEPTPTVQWAPRTSNRSRQQLRNAVAGYHQSLELRAQGAGGGNQISAGRVAMVKVSLRPFINQFGERFAIHSISAEDIRAYSTAQRLLVAQGELSPNTLFQRFAILKNFLNWCWEQEVINRLPRNIRSELKYGIPKPSKIEIFGWLKRDGEEVQRLIKACEERDEFLLMCVLLGLNCGYGLKDIADLRMEQFLWRGGDFTRLKRGRSKTGVYGSHVLWTRTEQLMRKYATGRYKTADLCFTMPDGSPLLTSRRGVMTCPLAKQFKQIVQRTFGEDDGRSWRTLRKTGATYCANKDWNTETLYLAHQPKTMAARFYAETPFHHLDRILCYMECDFGLSDRLVKRFADDPLRQSARSPNPPSDPTHAPERPGLPTARGNPFCVQPFGDGTDAQPFGSQLANPLHATILSNTTAEGFSAFAASCRRPLPLPRLPQLGDQTRLVVFCDRSQHLTDEPA